MRFLDRQSDIERLLLSLKREKTQFIVLYGRRRIGKSTLIQKVLNFSKGDIYFLADKTSEASQRQLFTATVGRSIRNFDIASYSNWESLFIAINERLTQRITICLDEFPYLVKSCPALPSILQKLLDSKELKFDLIICGSSQQMMQGLVLDNKEPLYGRADEIIRLQAIPAAYLKEAIGCTEKEAIEEYSIWGGIPRYWELRNNYEDIYSAIRNLVLDSHGVLYEEPSRLLQDEMRDTVQASTILSFIGNGANKLSEIAGRAERNATDITPQLARLRELGFINKQVPFGEDEKNSKKGLYYISDPFLRFHFRYVVPYRSIIEIGHSDIVLNMFKDTENDYTGYCWEDLCRQFITGNQIEGVVYNKAQRWWGNYYDKEEGQYKEAELDVVAESLDKKHLLIGECKWTNQEDAIRLMNKLGKIAEGLPFRKKQEIHIVLFLKETPTHADAAHIFLPADIMTIFN